MMRWGLFLSLALNVLLIGAAVGVGFGEWRHQKERANVAVARAPNMKAVLDSLPPARATQVREKVVDAWRNAQSERSEARAARVEVARAAAADPYDRAAVIAAFEHLRAADARVSERVQNVVADAMADMTVEERRAMLRNLAARRLGGMRNGEPGPLQRRLMERRQRLGLPQPQQPQEPSRAP